MQDFTRTNPETGAVEHAFGCYGSVASELDIEAGDCGIALFLEELSKILPDGEAVVVYEAGYENLRYVIGDAYVAVKGKPLYYMSTRTAATSAAREMTGNPELSLDDSY